MAQLTTAVFTVAAAMLTAELAGGPGGALRAFGPSDARADTSLLTGGWSEHLDETGDPNEVHHGTGLMSSHDVGPFRTGGVAWSFTNSYDEDALYAGGSISLCMRAGVLRVEGCLGVTGGGATGYEAISGMAVTPFGGMTAEASYRGVGAFVVCVPPLAAALPPLGSLREPAGGGVCMLALKIPVTVGTP